MSPGKILANRLRRALCTAAALLATPGCAPFTYLAPQPVARDVASSAGRASASAAPRTWPFPGVEAMCDHTLRGATHQVSAFTLGGDIGICLATPIMGSYAVPEDPRLSFSRPCARGAAGGVRGNTGRLIFPVFLGARSAELAVDQAVGVLEVDGRSFTGQADVQAREFLDMPPGTLIDGQLRYPVDATWVSFAQAVPHYTRRGYRLAFGFDHACDPDARYRLTLHGIRADGQALEIPAVEFAPVSESLPRLD